MTKKTDIVVTTIYEPTWMRGYLDNLDHHGHKNDVTLRIICDQKTPASVYMAANKASKEGFNVDCPTLSEQEEYLKKLNVDSNFIPWNSDNRRNIGFLRAWETGADVLISIDDDNYCRSDSDFVGSHHVVGQTVQNQAEERLATGGRWFNICSLLETQVNDPIYPRGFPYAVRDEQVLARYGEIAKVDGTRLAVNAGLWLDDPDVDAITRMAQRPCASSAITGGVVLSDETWSPINTQNTALIREAIPAYYYIKMGYQLQGLPIDRFGDILSGYFVQKCAKHMGDLIRFGSPVADHHRTPHNLLKDLSQELGGIALIEEFIPWLMEVHLEGNAYPDVYESLANAIQEESSSFSGFIWDQGGREFLGETANLMKKWLSLLESIS